MTPLRSSLNRLVLALLLAALAAPAEATSHESDVERVGRQVFDLAVLRPLGFVQTLTSATFFVLAIPVAAATGTADELVEICLTQPAERTFRRPLGML